MDRRTRKTRLAIINSFLDLNSEKEISKISISEITERADIGRGTFYTHFRDIYDLEEAIISDFIGNIKEIIQTSYSHHHEMDIYVQILIQVINILEEQKDFYRKLLLLKNSTAFTNRLTKELIAIIRTEEKNTFNSQEQVELVLFVSGWSTVITEWLSENIEIPVDDLKEMVINIYKEMFE